MGSTERKEVPQLKKQMMGGEWYLYECEHASQPGSLYGKAGILPVGEHANILLCKYCWQNITNMMLADLFRELISQGPSPALKEMLGDLLARMADVPPMRHGDPRWGRPAPGETTDG